ncbi:hypothetical protein ZWY2020_018927 [Hordeum vulgare]|nr:hypothetical protein ZWY2020_018927 [Hordeum vulgare]
MATAPPRSRPSRTSSSRRFSSSSRPTTQPASSSLVCKSWGCVVSRPAFRMAEDNRLGLSEESVGNQPQSEQGRRVSDEDDICNLVPVVSFYTPAPRGEHQNQLASKPSEKPYLLYFI